MKTTHASSQSAESIRRLLLALKTQTLADGRNIDLTKSEKLTIVNLLPTRMDELRPIIEQSDKRFTREELQTILSIIKNHI